MRNQILKTIGMMAGAATLACAAGPSVAKDITMAYVAASMQYPFNVAVAKGFQDVAKELGAKTVVLDPRGSVERQGNAIDDLIAQKVDGISAIVLDSVVSQSWVDRAADAKIPFVATAVQVGDPEKMPLRTVYGRLSALVTTDYVLSGERAGQLASSLLPKNRVAKIGAVEGAPGYSVVRQVQEGFVKALKQSGAKYQIVASQPTDWTPEKGESVCQNILTAHPDVDLIFSQADDMAIGCARALRAANAKAKLGATGGGSKLGLDAIKNGELDGSVCVKPELMGRMAAKALYEAITNKRTTNARFVTYVTPIITKANLAACPPEW